MKKIKFLIVFNILFIMEIFANDLHFSLFPIELTTEYPFINEQNALFVLYDNVFFSGVEYDGYRFLYEPEKFYGIKAQNVLIDTSNGFYYFSYNAGNGSSDYYIPTLYIPGKINTLFFPYYELDLLKTKQSMSENLVRKRNNFLRDKFLNITDYVKYNATSLGAMKVRNCGVKSIKASSYLVEGNVKYEPSNILNRIFIEYDYEYNLTKLDYITPPWVEGVKGYGIGEYLDVEFDHAVSQIEILNGFVDLDRPWLFLENSRVKTLIIESLDGSFSKEYELKEFVEMSYIEFPCKTTKVRMTIKDVYPGTKYDDTCITALFVIDSDKTNSSQIVNNVQQMIQNNGAWSDVDLLLE